MENEKQTEPEEFQRQTEGKACWWEATLCVAAQTCSCSNQACLQQASRTVLQQEVHETAERLQQLELQKQNLESKGIMLEHLLKTKHEQAKILHENAYKQVEFSQ